MYKRLALVIGLSATIFLAACGGGGSGGGGDGNPGPVTEIPASANNSVDALAAFFVTQLAAVFETTEPLGINNVGDFVTSDTTEPSPI